jgi:hypothetical protein
MQRLGLEPGTFRLQTVGSTAAPGPPFDDTDIINEIFSELQIHLRELSNGPLPCQIQLTVRRL